MDLIGDEQGRLDRLAGWLRATPAEALGLVVLLTGSLAASLVLVWSTLVTGGGSEVVAPPGDAGDVAVAGDTATDVGTDATTGGGADAATPTGDGAGVGDDPGAAPPGQPPGTGTGTPADAAADAASTADVTVHVAGAVTDPGVVTLPAGARVADAVAAAGGAAAEADLDRTNLARVLADGEHLVVLREGEDPPAPVPDPPPSADTAATPGGAPSPGDALVDVNTASAAELEALPGIGPGLSARIVEHRERHGPFREPGDLRDVSGIGEVRFQELADRVTVG